MVLKIFSLQSATSPLRPVLCVCVILFLLTSCKEDDETENHKPKADFIFTVKNQGQLPAIVSVSSTSKNATSLQWDFGNGTSSTSNDAEVVYTNAGTYKIRLTITNQFGADSISKPVTVKLDRPFADFTFTMSNPEVLPITVVFTNASTGSHVTFAWTIDGSTLTVPSPEYSFNAGGNYPVTLTATNRAGSHSVTKLISIPPYSRGYITFGGAAINLFAWEGDHVMILSRNNNLNRATMYKWLRAMDETYAYYKLCNGRDPYLYMPNYYLNNRATVADVPATCGAGCGYLGATGIEMQNTYFDIGYHAINNNNQYDQVVFYEFGRNFWFCGNQLAYKTNDPVTTGYAVFMRFMAMKAANVNGAPFGALSFDVFQNSVINLFDQYMGNPSLTWENTLGAGQGVPGGFGGGADLFASFCFRLTKDYGETFVQNVWKIAATRQNAITTQDAVDNFFLASCAAANKNLTTVFQSWRWPLSAAAISSATQYP